MILKGALGKPLFKENVDQGAAISDFKNFIIQIDTSNDFIQPKMIGLIKCTKSNARNS